MYVIDVAGAQGKTHHEHQGQGNELFHSIPSFNQFSSFRLDMAYFTMFFKCNMDEKTPHFWIW